MTDSDAPRSPFAAMADLSAHRPIRAFSAGEIEQMLASHELYLKTEYHEGHRADFSLADLTARDFAGLGLRGIKIDRALLRGANFTGADLRGANLIGAAAQEARFDRADLSRARLSGANLVSASFEDARLIKAEMEFALMANAALQGANLREADMSGAQLDGAVLTRADLRKTNAPCLRPLISPVCARPGCRRNEKPFRVGICDRHVPPGHRQGRSLLQSFLFSGTCDCRSIFCR